MCLQCYENIIQNVRSMFKSITISVSWIVGRPKVSLVCNILIEKRKIGTSYHDNMSNRIYFVMLT